MSHTEKSAIQSGLATEIPDKATTREEINEVKREIIDNYDHRPSENPIERKLSPIIHVRSLTNWVKSALIKSFARSGARVLDLGCGHGGDLLKYNAVHIGHYVGVDLSFESLKEAIRRYNASKLHFPAKFVCGDIAEKIVNRDFVLEDGVAYDLVSSQLTMQFAWTGERQVRTFFRNVTDRLEPGGYFIGTLPNPIKLMEHLVASPDHQTIQIGNICKIKFRQYLDKINQNTDPYGIIYDVSLGEVMQDAPEYLISLPIFEKMAAEYGLQSKFFMDFQEFYLEYKNLPPYSTLLRIHNVPTSQEQIPPAEWDVLSLYTVFAFQKVPGASMKKVGHLNEKDIVFVS